MNRFCRGGVRSDQHMMSSCEPPTKKIYLYPYFMFKGQKRDVQRAGEERGQKQLVSYQNILTNI